MILKILQRIASLILLLSVILGILFFILFPKYPDIKATFDQLDSERLARNTTLQLLTKISPPNQAMIVEDISQPTNIEHISENDLIKWKNEGEITFNMEAQETTLYIPSVNINGKVIDSENSSGMEKGFWHFPLSGQPGFKGNTVIIAHRFKYLPPRTDTFFMLDKVQIGDKIILNQKNNSYKYTVVENRIVEKNSREILYKTNDYRITLITCHPLWSSEKRYVVIGKLDKIYGNI